MENFYLDIALKLLGLKEHTLITMISSTITYSTTILFIITQCRSLHKICLKLVNYLEVGFSHENSYMIALSGISFSLLSIIYIFLATFKRVMDSGKPAVWYHWLYFLTINELVICIILFHIYPSFCDLNQMYEKEKQLISEINSMRGSNYFKTEMISARIIGQARQINK